MAVKNYKKHHAGKKRTTVENDIQFSLPVIDHPLKFWTLHPKEPTFVDLSEFSEGRKTYNRGAGFAGRPTLIVQLSDPLREFFRLYASRSVSQRQSIMRNWWRALDDLEKSSDFHSINGVEDFNYLNLSLIRERFAGDVFSWFLSMVNIARAQLGIVRLQIGAYDKPEPNRYLPDDSSSKLIRLEMKKVWQDTRNKWSMVDSYVWEEFAPKDAEQVEFQRHREYMDRVCSSNKVAFPTKEQVQGRYRNFADQSGLLKSKCYNSKFPNRAEVNSALHMCLAGTGWNSSVMCRIDATRLDAVLYNHPKDPARYVLCDTKPRAKGQEQFATGLWKTPWGAGYIIKLVESRTRLLRDELNLQLAAEMAEYEQLQKEKICFDLLLDVAKRIQRLQAGVLSLWLFVDGSGAISWIDDASSIQTTENGQPYSFMQLLLQRINSRRLKEGDVPIQPVSVSDFRDMFAEFIWRQTGGSILAVMNLLSHARLSSTSKYIDNNILNKESDERSVKLIDEFFLQLKNGQLDLTVLAHSMRFGDIDELGIGRLTSYRALERSRLGVGCKNSYNPPDLIRTQSATAGRCTSQRCTLCLENAVIFRDSVDGICMRAEELEAMKPSIPVDLWILSSFDSELNNCQRILELFPQDEVLTIRKKWRTLIATGEHRFPGR